MSRSLIIANRIPCYELFAHSYPTLPPPYQFSSSDPGTFFFFFNLFLAVLGLRCCARAFSSCGEQGLLFVAVRGLLIAVASLVAEHGL